jgi:site-specific recombinase XerD
MGSRMGLLPAEPKIEAFLTDLAVHGNVAPATRNQALNALMSLYKRVLSERLPGSLNAVHADKRDTVPVVMTHQEVAAVFSLMDGTIQLVAKLLYRSGLRIMEVARLRGNHLVVFCLRRGTLQSHYPCHHGRHRTRRWHDSATAQHNDPAA